jgi:hypothetical protein
MTEFLKSPDWQTDPMVLSFLQKLIVAMMKEISSLFFLFLEPKSALQFSQKPGIGNYCEPV